MPRYRRNTRQWCEARVAEINQTAGRNTPAEIAEHQELIAGLVAGIYPEDINPSYSAAELESEGQGTLI